MPGALCLVLPARSFFPVSGCYCLNNDSEHEFETSIDRLILAQFRTLFARKLNRFLFTRNVHDRLLCSFRFSADSALALSELLTSCRARNLSSRLIGPIGNLADMVDHSEHGIDLLEPLPTTFAGWQNAEVEDDGSADGAAATARPRRRSRSDSLNGRDQQQPMQLDLIPPAAPLAAASAAHRVSSPDALASTESSSSAASASAASGDNTSSSDAASTASAGSSSPQHPFSSSSSADDRDADAHSRNGEPGSSGSAAESKEEDHGTQQQGKRACLAVHLSDSQRHLPIKRSEYVRFSLFVQLPLLSLRLLHLCSAAIGRDGCVGVLQRAILPHVPARQRTACARRALPAGRR